MKKTAFLSLFLILLLSLSACSSTKLNLFPVELARTDALDSPVEGATVAVGCSVNSPLSGIEFHLQITGDSPKIKVSVYEAERDYETTLSNPPVREETLTDLADKMLYQFRTLDAGDYLIVFTEAEGAALMKSVLPSDAANQKVLCLRNGQRMTDGTCGITLLLVKTETNPEPSLITFQYPILEQ